MTIPIRIKILTSAFLVAASLVASTPVFAAFAPVPANTPEAAAIPVSTVNGTTGTVLFTLENSYLDAFGSSATGTVRSMAVRNSLGTLDFYYQVINTSTNFGLDEIFRFEAAGYGNDSLFTVQAAYRTDVTLGVFPGVTGVPLSFITTNLPTPGNAVASADRDPVSRNIPESAMFDFQAFPDFFGPDTIKPGEASNWLIFRTNANLVSTNTLTINSTGGTGFALGLVPIPEPSTILFGLALSGVCVGVRFRRALGTKSQNEA